MEGHTKYVKFFRFRSRLLNETGPTENWLYDAFKNIDFSREDFLEGSIIICKLTKGGFSFDNICGLFYDEYVKLFEILNKLQKAESEENE